jgi:hypothetical protein
VLSHTLTQHSTSTPLPKPERHGFTPKKGTTWVSLGGDQSPLLPPEAGLNLNLGSYQSDEWGPRLVPEPFQAPLGNWSFFGSLGVKFPPPDPHGLVVHGRGGPPGGLGTLSQQEGGENTTLQIPDDAPRNIAGGLRQRLRGHQSFQESSLLSKWQ